MRKVFLRGPVDLAIEQVVHTGTIDLVIDVDGMRVRMPMSHDAARDLAVALLAIVEPEAALVDASGKPVQL
jgi:hypothetical protein